MDSQVSAGTHRYAHVFSAGNPLAERNTRRAMLLTAVMMVAEISGGWIFNSMALLADGWHMSSHTLALGLAVLAYACARRYADDRRFAFGTWKIEVLGGYTSAILLLCVAGVMAFQSVERLFAPLSIHYEQAIVLAAMGLMVNLICAWWLRDRHHHHSHPHEHGREHGHAREAHHHDLNLRAAYLHVLADAATSVLAIVALLGGKYWGAVWLDPVMGIVGAMLVTVWAVGLLRATGRVLLDAEMNAPVVQEIHETLAEDEEHVAISDLHVWRIGGDRYACIIALVDAIGRSPDYFRDKLAMHDALAHIIVEVNRPDIGAVARSV